MNLFGNDLTLIAVGIESAQELLPAFNGDAQFLRWSGYPSGMMSLQEVRDDIQETAALPGGTTWRIADREGRLIGVAETALHPSATRGGDPCGQYRLNKSNRGRNTSKNIPVATEFELVLFCFFETHAR